MSAGFLHTYLQQPLVLRLPEIPLTKQTLFFILFYSDLRFER
jgi:hypothetical protein